MAISMNHSSIDSLRGYFPELDSSGWRMLGEGFGSSVYEHRPGQIVIRAARSLSAGRRMAVVLSGLEWIAPRLPVSVPEPIWQLEPDIDAESPFGAFSYRKLPGDILQPETVADGTVESLTEVLSVLHRLPVPDPEQIVFQEPRDYHRIRREQYSTIRELLENRLARTEFDRIEAWQSQPVPEPARLTVIHGDFWHENILIDRESRRVTGVLDWENLALGDPAQDLVPLRYLGDQTAERVLRGYLAKTGEDEADFSRRMSWWWGNRDFDGIYLALEMHDEEEIADGIRKLREGPILTS
jgi:aminoglycoside phosphotransferase (APT) family kinase protein